MTKAEVPDEPIKYRWVDRLTEVHARCEALNPTYLSLKRLQSIELHPQLFIELRSLDELDTATMERRIEDTNAVVVLTRTAERYFGDKGHAFASAAGGLEERARHRSRLRQEQCRRL